MHFIKKCNSVVKLLLLRTDHPPSSAKCTSEWLRVLLLLRSTYKSYRNSLLNLIRSCGTLSLAPVPEPSGQGYGKNPALMSPWNIWVVLSHSICMWLCVFVCASSLWIKTRNFGKLSVRWNMAVCVWHDDVLYRFAGSKQ